MREAMGEISMYIGLLILIVDTVEAFYANATFG